MRDQTEIEQIQKEHGFASKDPEELMRAAKRDARKGKGPAKGTPQKKAALNKKTVTAPAAARTKVTKKKAPTKRLPVAATGPSVKHPASTPNTDRLIDVSPIASDGEYAEGVEDGHGPKAAVGRGGEDGDDDTIGVATPSQAPAAKAIQSSGSGEAGGSRKTAKGVSLKNIARPNFRIADGGETGGFKVSSQPPRKSRDCHAVANKAGDQAEDEGVVRSGADGRMGIGINAMSGVVAKRKTAAETKKNAANNGTFPQPFQGPAVQSANSTLSDNTRRLPTTTAEVRRMGMLHYCSIGWNSGRPTLVFTDNATVKHNTATYEHGGQVQRVNLGNGQETDVMVCDFWFCSNCYAGNGIDTNTPSPMKGKPFVHAVEIVIRDGDYHFKPKSKPLAHNTPQLETKTHLVQFSSSGAPFASMVEVCMGKDCEPCMKANTRPYPQIVDPTFGLLDDVGGVYGSVAGEERSTLHNMPASFSDRLNDPGFATPNTFQPRWEAPNFSAEAGYVTSLASINDPNATENPIWTPPLPFDLDPLLNPYQDGDTGTQVGGSRKPRSLAGQLLGSDAFTDATEALRDEEHQKRKQRKTIKPPLSQHVSGTTYEVLGRVAGLGTEN